MSEKQKKINTLGPKGFQITRDQLLFLLRFLKKQNGVVLTFKVTKLHQLQDQLEAFCRDYKDIQ